MKKIWLLALLCVGLSLHASVNPSESDIYKPFILDGVQHVVVDKGWNINKRGSHRALIKIRNSAERAVSVTLKWRRPDLRIKDKAVLIVGAVSGKEVDNICCKSMNSEIGEFIFQPNSNEQEYYVYYLPFNYLKGSGDARYGKPWNRYLEPQYSKDSTWISKSMNSFADLPKAQVVRFEERTKFEAFTPMGLIATEKEMDSIKSRHPENPVIFTEDRAFPIRLRNQIASRWVNKGPSRRFAGEALRNEYYVWQIGLWAAHHEVKNVSVAFSDFINSESKRKIDKKNITCFNTEGINWDGTLVHFDVNIPAGKVQALWCGIDVPMDTEPGLYKGVVTISDNSNRIQKVDIELKVSSEISLDKGDNELWKHARLRWLNSTIGMDDNPVAPYDRMIVKGNKITATGKDVIVGKNGLISSIKINNKEVLAEPLDLILYTSEGIIKLDGKDAAVKQNADGLASWRAEYVKGGIEIICNAKMEFDGYIDYDISAKSDNKLQINNLMLVSRYTPYVSKYFMGVGFPGGYSPEMYSWNWKGPWDSYWVGNALAGLHFEFKGSSYNGPLLNDYKPEAPGSWANCGKGRITVQKESDKLAIQASTGSFWLNQSEKHFKFSLLITPVKEVEVSKHFSERYYHANPEGFDKAALEGANVANIHHAQSLNPVINYPFIVQEPLKQFIAHQHKNNRKVKLYYTIRELTNHTAEIYALKSLNHEILAAGVGYGLPWQCEHLIDDYKPAWYVELPDGDYDAALVLTPFSRWINYYLEGLRWMFENYKIDGIYMDDVSFDRRVMKRMRKIMERYRPGSLIDLHSNTWYSVGPANQYTDFFPYINRTWFGESFKYNEMTPDQWFVRFSSIPYGLMSEMLQDGGNQYLGMVYGTTSRHSYYKSNPAPVWALWKKFNIEKSEMIGYWAERPLVSTGVEMVKATAYVKPDEVMISIGNFDTIPHQVNLTIDWKRIKMNKKKAEIIVPDIAGFQKSQEINLDKGFDVEAKKGIILIIRK